MKKQMIEQLDMIYVRMYMPNFISEEPEAQVQNAPHPGNSRSHTLQTTPHIYIYVYTYVCMYVCMYVRTYVRMYACMHACMYVCLYVYVCICVCIDM